MAAAVKPKLRIHADKVTLVTIGKIKPYPQNAKHHSPEQIAQLKATILEHGFTKPILIEAKTNEIIAGHGAYLAALDIGMSHVPCIVIAGLSKEKIRALRLSDNKIAEHSDWDADILKAELGDLQKLGMDLNLTGFLAAELGEMGFGGAGELGNAALAGNLAERFGVPPFSVLNAREGWWQDRKRSWIALGIQSEVGRGENLLRFSDTVLEPDPAKRAAKKAAKGKPRG